jgi:hypothetical protein
VRQIAKRRLATAAIGSHRRDAHDGRADLREQSHAKQQLGETAVEHEAGDSGLSNC